MRSSSRWRFVLAAAGLVTGVFVVAGSQTAAQATTSSPSVTASSVQGPGGLRRGAMPYGATARATTAPTAQAAIPRAAGAAHLDYYGGHVVSAIKVHEVVYGTGTYMAQTTSTGSPSMSSFYAGVTNSAYVDWLNEYNTSITAIGGQAGTNQAIGRGTFAGLTTITPSSANNGASITDAQVQSELTAQINAGALPAPAVDAQGNAISYYSVFFRHGQKICDGTSCSLVSGGFCAYHGTMTVNGREAFYAVHPDLVGISGCGSSTSFNNTTSVASHELIETVTDAEVGIATTYAPPLAWYDQTHSGLGEIGDICNAQQGTVVGGDGVTYTIQKEWSNVSSACIATRAATNDFSLSASPTSLTITAGGSATSTISSATTSGAAQTVSLSATGAPAGVTLALSPTSVSSGASSTLTVSTTAAASTGTFTITVTGTGASATHTTSVTLTVNGTGGGGTSVTNGGFETGTFSGWTVSGPSTAVVAGGHTGSFSGRAGSASPTNGSSNIVQTFTAASGTTSLKFWYSVTCPDTVTYDWATATLKDVTANTTSTILAKTCTNGAGWKQVSASVVAGHQYTLTLTSKDDNYVGDATYTLFDDVTVS